MALRKIIKKRAKAKADMKEDVKLKKKIIEKFVLAMMPTGEFAVMAPAEIKTMDVAARDKALRFIFHQTAKEADEQWHDFFTEFGTHYLATVKLGGKMVHTCTLSKEDSEQIEKSGMSAAAALEVETSVVAVSGSVEGSQRAESIKKFSSSEKEESTKVLGGAPPSSGADDKAGFAEWAETVADGPMPVKYTLRPLTSVGDLDKVTNWAHTFNVMVTKYSMDTIKKAKSDYLQARHNKKKGAGGSANEKPSQLEPNGAPLTSDGEPLTHGHYTLVLLPNGALQIKNSKLETVLWDSLVTDDGNGPFRLAYLSDGNLVIQNKHEKVVWQTQTKTTTCVGTNGMGKPPSKVIFNGDLVVMAAAGREDEPVWHAGTKGKDGFKNPKSDAQKASMDNFGGGKNLCITEANCVEMFYEYKYEKSGSFQKKLGPGNYAEDAVGDFYADVNSIRVNEDNCWIRTYADSTYEGYSDFYTSDCADTTDCKPHNCPTEATDECYSVRVYRQWVRAGTNLFVPCAINEWYPLIYTPFPQHDLCV
jgi:hypothetical protein